MMQEHIIIGNICTNTLSSHKEILSMQTHLYEWLLDKQHPFWVSCTLASQTCTPKMPCIGIQYKQGENEINLNKGWTCIG